MKTISHLLSLCIITSVIFAYSCQKSSQTIINDRSAALARIEQAIRGSIGWAKNKDFDLLYSIIANDSNYLEVGPGEGLTLDFEQFKKNANFWGSPDFKAIRYDISDLRVNLSHSGDVAWFYCILNDINEWKGQPANWENVRWTGVLEKREGQWRIVQNHFSFLIK